MKKLFFLILTIVFCFDQAVNADTFELHFLYDAKSGILQFENSQNAVLINKNNSLSITEHFQSFTTGDFEFIFLDRTDTEIDRKNFEPQNGSFVVEVPYYSTAVKLLIQKKNIKDPILSYDLASLSTCNGNNICEYEKGENLDTCLADCTGTAVQYSADTKTVLDQNSGVVRDPKTGDILLNNVKPQEIPTAQTPAEVNKTQFTMSSTLKTALFILFVTFATVGAVWFIRRNND